MARKVKFLNISLRQLIVSFGFLEGVWLAIGLRPTEAVFDLLSKFLLIFFSNNFILVFFLKILPVTIFLLSLYLIYRLGGLLGFFAVSIAFISGLLIFSAPFAAVIFLILALGIGFFAKK
jgi:hypothetical protein